MRTGWASTADVRRCAAAATRAHPDPADWQPLLTARRNGIRVIAFGSPDGVVFAELTPKRVTLSQPAVGASAGEGASVTFHTEFGTIAGVVAPEVGSLVVERPADRRPLGWTPAHAVGDDNHPRIIWDCHGGRTASSHRPEVTDDRDFLAQLLSLQTGCGFASA
ncbi:hypothetical protein ACFWD7_29330 [Streptomyces mirabilis]|uniref:hypothetical protein n=1 Tax=Streptomyces mirabilis TaxID=68239 RepID=UPI003679B064